MPNCLSESQYTAGTHFIEVALPASASKSAGFFQGSGFGRQRSQREVDSFAFGRKAIAPHDFGASHIVDVHIGACHTPKIHQPLAGCKTGEWSNVNHWWERTGLGTLQIGEFAHTHLSRLLRFFSDVYTGTPRSWRAFSTSSEKVRLSAPVTTTCS